jgi:hypothetical protein
MRHFLLEKSTVKLGLKSIHTVRSKNRIFPKNFLLLVIAISALFVISSLSQLALVASSYSASSAVNQSNTGSGGLCSVTSNGQEEEYINTFAVNSQNHLQAYAITGAEVFRNVVGTTNKIYLFVYIHPASTFAVGTAGATKSCTSNLTTKTNDMYWDAQVGTTGSRDFATVGGDLVSDSSSGLMLFDQYININGVPGTNSPNNPPSTSGPSCFVDTGGQERSSVYMLFVDDANPKRSYEIDGSTMAEISVAGVYQTAFYVFLSSTTMGVGTTPGKANSCSMSLSHATPSFEWAVRAPPAAAKISGNYRIYGTLGGNCPPNTEGTNAGIIEQFTDSSYQF